MHRHVIATVLAALLTGCVVGDVEDEAAPAPMEPTFAATAPAGAAPDPAAESTPAPSPEPGAGTPAEPVTAPPGSAPSAPTTSAAPSGTTSTPAPTVSPATSVLAARITDPRGDTTASLEREPSWSDIVGAELRRRGDAFTLWVDLDGGAPSGSGSADHTMNVASFYDLSGDGRIDVEVWANLADGGWDSALYDNRDGSGGFSDQDPVEVRVDGDRLRIDFPASVLDGSTAFRWAVASEWGRYEQLGTALTVRDDAPDDDRPASFPN